ncbi:MULTISPECIES: rhodanese-like domain-containing protein [unclassified Enterococcus]|uniref:rhodanese-like domain-containing protein n=1 Tax=unclassified Enterococcus TaxID=2608891 RepID=UPI0013EB5BE1|nr:MULTISPECIES: rhodanese-like domain-containing protein [unclassified Enterococcus]
MNFLFQPVKTISIQELQGRLADSPVLLDVRTPSEYRSGHIKQAKNVPLQKINGYNGEKDKTVYVICQSGMRSKQAAKELTKAGYDVINVRGGMNQWTGQLAGGK